MAVENSAGYIRLAYPDDRELLRALYELGTTHLDTLNPTDRSVIAKLLERLRSGRDPSIPHYRNVKRMCDARGVEVRIELDGKFADDPIESPARIARRRAIEEEVKLEFGRLTALRFDSDGNDAGLALEHREPEPEQAPKGDVFDALGIPAPVDAALAEPIVATAVVETVAELAEKLALALADLSTAARNAAKGGR